MHLEYQALLQDDPELEARLKRLARAPSSAAASAWPRAPAASSSATRSRRSTRRRASSPRRPARPAGISTTSTATRSSRSPARSSPASAPSPDTPRKCTTEEKTLVEIRDKVEKHIKNTYLKRVDAPVGRQAGAQVLDGTERGLSRCRPTTAPSSPSIKRFDQLVAYLRDEMGWPIERRRLRGPDLRLHARRARHRREERGQDPGDQAPAPARRRTSPGASSSSSSSRSGSRSSRCAAS